MYVNLLRCFPGSITLQMPQMKLGFTIDPQQHWWPNNQQQKNVLRREGRLLTEAKAWNLGRKLGKKKNELSQKELRSRKITTFSALPSQYGTRSAQWANHKNNVSESCLQVAYKLPSSCLQAPNDLQTPLMKNCCTFQQCEYCEVRNVIMEFFTSLIPKKAFQITRLRHMIWKTFSAFVMWKTQYSHVLLTVFSHYCNGVRIGFLYYCNTPHFNFEQNSATF